MRILQSSSNHAINDIKTRVIIQNFSLITQTFTETPQFLLYARLQTGRIMVW